MTETELIDRLREAIVLDGPDVWRTNGYLQEAQAAGLSLPAALKRANEVNQEVANNGLLFQNIQARIARMAQPSRSAYVEQDLNQIIQAARSLNLSPDFVRNRWVPTVLARVSGTPTPSSPEPPAPTPVAPAPSPAAPADTFDELLETKPEPVQPTPEVKAPPVAPAPPERVQPPAPEPVPVTPVSPPPTAAPVTPTYSTPSTNYSRPSSPPEPPPIVRTFTASPARITRGQPVTLSWDVGNVLAVTIDDLGAGLSPQNRGWVKPVKTTDYTLFDANNNPLSTVRVEVIPPDRSGIYGVLFALALLGLIYWFVRNTNAQPEPDPQPKRRTERTKRTTSRRTETSGVSQQKPDEDVATSEASDLPVKAEDKPTVASAEPPKPKNEPVSQPPEDEQTPSEPVSRPASPADARQGKYEESFGDKPYDKIELGTDERGWRRARSGGRWGYVNEADEWVIQPEYEAVTPFRGNTAAVFKDGKLMTINRSGEVVRN